MSNIPESDPYGTPQHTKGAKLDAGKLRVDLLLDFSRALQAVTQVAQFGAEKYSPDGWLEVPDGERRYKAAGMRHLLTEQRQYLDEDSGLPHIYHRVWNALAELERHLINKESTDSKSKSLAFGHPPHAVSPRLLQG